MTHQRLEEWLETLSKIIFDVSISLNNAERLFIEKYPNEHNLLKHSFFRHYYYQLWFICTVQMSKMVSAKKNQKYNLHYLLNELRPENLDNELIFRIKSNIDLPFNAPFKSIEQLDKSINYYKQKLREQSGIIDKITSSRNKLYAHRDKDAKLEELTLDNLRALLNVCIEIYNGIRGGFYNVSVDFSFIDSWSIDYLIKKASHY